MHANHCSVTMAHMMLPQHANPDGNVHGGVIIKYMDDAAAAVAMKHARTTVVTVAIDRVVFHRPVNIGDLLSIMASLNYTGKTSMEIGVRVEAENLRTAAIHHIASAYLTFVSLDTNLKPKTVPTYSPETDEEKRRHREAKERRAISYKHR